MMSRIALLLLLSPISILAQVPLPNPAWQPPDVDSAKIQSNSPGSVNQRWSDLLGDVLYYYDIQRSGKLPSDFRVKWRNDSVLNDGSDVGIDLSGGFFDAGNYIKATFPLCWMVTFLSWGAIMFGNGIDGSGQTPYLDESLRVALDWILAASSKPDQLVVVVGSDKDDYWGGDVNIPTYRPSFVVSRSSPGTDVFGSCSGALASASLLYNGVALPISKSQNGSVPTMKDTTYAQALLDRSQTLFNLAQTSTPQQVYQKAVKGVDWAYPSTEFDDELILSSTFLALATGNQSYADYAQKIYTDYKYPVPNGALNWDGHAAAVPVLLSQLAIQNPSMGISLSKYQSDAEVWFDNIIKGKMDQTFTTKGGLFWWKGDSDPASTNPTVHASALMLMYRAMASTNGKETSYTSFAQSQVDYLLGKNPMNAVYIVGVHPNSAQNPHTALASGGNPDGSQIDTYPAKEAYVLYGGMVGGPDKNDNYYDKRSDWVQTEAAIGSQAALINVISYMLSSNAPDPYYVSLTADRLKPTGSSSGSNDGSNLSTGALAGIIVGGVIFLILVATGLYYWWRSRSSRMSHRHQSERLVHD